MKKKKKKKSTYDNFTAIPFIGGFPFDRINYRARILFDKTALACPEDWGLKGGRAKCHRYRVAFAYHVTMHRYAGN